MNARNTVNVKAKTTVHQDGEESNPGDPDPNQEHDTEDDQFQVDEQQHQKLKLRQEGQQLEDD